MTILPRFACIIAVLAAVTLSACSSANESSFGAVATKNPGSASASVATGTARVAINIPARATAAKAKARVRARRRREALPLETASVGITVTAVNGIAATNPAPTYVDLLASSSDCVPDASQEALVVCSVAVTAPAGSDTFAFTAYDDYGGTGTALAAGQTTAVIPSGGSATIPVVLDGIVAAIVVEVDTPAVTAGVTQTVNISVNALDPDGASVIGDDPFTAPITLTANDPQGLLALNSTTITSPATFVTGTIDATNVVSGNVSIGAAAQGIAASAVTSAVVTITNDRNWTNGATFTYAGSSTTQSTSTGYAPSTATSSLASVESIAVNGPSITRTVATTTTPSGGSASTVTSVYGYYLDGQYTTTALQLSTFSETNAYGSTLQYRYTGDDVVDQFPETSGATFAQSDAFDSTFSATASDPEPSQTYEQLSDGTYQYMDSYGDGDSSAADDEAAPLPGATPATYQYTQAGGTQLSYGFQNPTGPGSGSGTIAISQTIVPSASPIATSATAAPDWQPPTIGFATGTYQTDVWTQRGPATIPTACGQAAAYGTTANDLHEDYASLDPIAGETYVRSNDIYVVSGTGIVCRASTVTAKYYYNLGYASSTSEALAAIFPGTLVYTATTTTTQGLQSIGHASGDARVHVADPRDVVRKPLVRPKPSGGIVAGRSLRISHVEVLP